MSQNANKIKISIDSPLSDINDFFISESKLLEQDEKNSLQIARELDEELKKYSDNFTPYPIFLAAYKSGVSDIKFLPFPKDNKGNDRSIVYFKIDWFWEKMFTIGRNKHILYINAIKNWSIKWAWNLNPENQRISQDGKGILHILNSDKSVEKTIQLRIASAPQHIKDDNGMVLEVCVIRLLDGEGNPTLEQAGFNKYDYSKLMALKKMKKGLALVSGPTGSGKSSTLFWFIDKINDWSKNIITFENPVEFDVPGISQIEINPKEDILDSDEITQNFRRSEEFAMRAAPDILLVWEMRSYDTAKAWVTFGNTGHLSLGTIHTNDVIETINRLLGFKKGEDSLDKRLLLSVLTYVSAQMLVPSMCPSCKVKVKNIPTTYKNEVEKDYFKQTLNSIQTQTFLVREELLLPNVKKIYPTLTEAVIDNWIQESYISSPNGCSKCKIREENQEVRWKIGKKGRMLINETLFFDAYIADALGEEPFSKDRIRKKLLEERPLIEDKQPGAIMDKENHFFTLYQDALFKALFPEKLYKKMYPGQTRFRGISILDALTYGK